MITKDRYLSAKEKRQLEYLKQKEKTYSPITEEEMANIESRAIDWRGRTLDYFQIIMDGWSKNQAWNRELADDNLRLISEINYLKDKLNTIQKQNNIPVEKEKE